MKFHGTYVTENYYHDFIQKLYRKMHKNWADMFENVVVLIL